MVYEKWIYITMKKEILINIILELAPDDVVKEVNDDTNIIADLDYDSLAMVEDFRERFECIGDIWDGIELLLGLK